MSAWVIALGLSAGYLMNKQLSFAQVVGEKVREYQSGGETAEIREVQRRVPDADKYGEINMRQPAADVKKLTDAREAAHREVAAYESGPPIQGVWLNLGDRGY